jgi:acylphosphatase
VDAYLILRYEIKGDVLTLHVMDGDARKRAIEAGKVKGVVEKDPHGNIRAYFTDTSENLARFVASAGDDLFVKDALRLERVK